MIKRGDFASPRDGCISRNRVAYFPGICTEQNFAWVAHGPAGNSSPDTSGNIWSKRYARLRTQ